MLNNYICQGTDTNSVQTILLQCNIIQRTNVLVYHTVCSVLSSNYWMICTDGATHGVWPKSVGK